jgi:nucleotide-binding universal stress UspA family protein/RimJ/RimL family protein N-acetyltransferase
METVPLRDGSQVEIRSIEPDDRDALREGFERLSPQSRYRRFFSPVAQLSERDLDYLTDVDHSDHEALVAVDPDSGEGVGVARYVRTGPEVAEPAIVVADDWQRRGVATRLLDALVGRALEEGVRRFEAPVLADNPAALRLLEQLGQATHSRDGTEVEVRVDLSPERSERDRLRRLIREFAAGALRPARTLLELIRPPHRRGAPGDPRRNVLVVGTDGSDDAAAAVEAAGLFAAESDAAIHVVGAHPFLMPGQDDTAATVREAADALRARGVHVHEEVRRGDPALVLTDVADESQARLILVGGGSPGGAARRLLGSTADHVAERAPCSVLIVRPRRA